MHVFRSLKLLAALLGSSSPLHVPKWSQNEPPNLSTHCQKLVQNITPTNYQNIANFGLQICTQNWQTLRSRGTAIFGRRFQKKTWSQDAPNMTQDCLKWPKIGPSWPKKGPKMLPKWSKIASTKDSPKVTQNTPKIPRMAQDDLKTP